MNPNKDDEQDLMKDLVAIITSFCCRLYGLRRMKNKLDKIKKVLSEPK
jgi:predicted site-specific integrase-resolvase